jgi:hypothetical protein
MGTEIRDAVPPSPELQKSLCLDFRRNAEEGWLPSPGERNTYDLQNLHPSLGPPRLRLGILRRSMNQGPWHMMGVSRQRAACVYSPAEWSVGDFAATVGFPRAFDVCRYFGLIWTRTYALLERLNGRCLREGKGRDQVEDD